MTPESFKRCRKMLRFSQSKIAEELGVSLRSVSEWERGSTEIPKRTALAMAALMRGIPPWE